MLINLAKEENAEETSPHTSPVSSGYHTHEYQSASELFEYMARHHKFDVQANNSLTTRDLVILYENIEIGTKLLTHANEVKRRLPNQLVETIIYKDDQSDSEVSENLSNEDLLHMCRTNNETLNLFTSTSQFDNILCHKSNMKHPNINLTSDYDKYFQFNDPYLKTQLKNLKLSTKEGESIFPTSLLDYLCCKRLEDNYNIYMENIIKYVTHTIEQLKRISNGDYLTEKAKQKWKEVPKYERRANDKDQDTKVLSTSTKVPLRIETKLTGMFNTWDDIVRSENDIKSLTKILEKKLIIEVPKVISGSYKVLSKQYADNLIISCESKANSSTEKKSRVDVVLQLERSKSGQVISHINSIMVLQATHPSVLTELVKSESVAFHGEIPMDNHKLLAIENVPDFKKEQDNASLKSENSKDNEEEQSDYELEPEQPEYSEFNEYDMTTSLPIVSLDSFVSTPSLIKSSLFETNLPNEDNPTNPETMHGLEALDTSAEEPVKKKTANKVRIKSPYANNSHIIEEKKRKKLLEIRERRVKRKMAFNESCKISKNKFFKGTVTPQAVNSVTKLSISNKSFYNSIYGQFTTESNNKKSRNISKKDSVPEIILQKIEPEAPQRKISSDKNSLKFIDRSYYLDNTVTAMDLQKSQLPDTDRKSDSNSDVSTKLLNMNVFSELMESFTESIAVKTSNIENECKNVKFNESEAISDSTTSAEPWSEEIDMRPPNRLNSTLECRKSIEKIYTLMNKPDTLKKTSRTEEPDSNKIANTIRSVKADDKSKGNKKNAIYTAKKQVPDNPLKAISQLLHEMDNVKKIKQKATNEAKVFRRQPIAPKDLMKSNAQINLTKKNPTNELIEERKNTDRFSRYNVFRDKKAVRSTSNVESFRSTSPRKYSPNGTSPKRLSPARAMSPKKISFEDNKKRISDLIDEVKEAKGEAVKGPSRNSARLNALAQPKKSYVVAHSEEYQSRYGRNLTAVRLDRHAAATDRHNVRNRVKRTTNEPLQNIAHKTTSANQQISPNKQIDTRIRSSTRNRSPVQQNSGYNSVRDMIKVISVEEAKSIAKREQKVPIDKYARPAILSAVEEETPTTERAPQVPQDWDSLVKIRRSKINSPIDGSIGSSLTNSSDMGLLLHKIINKITRNDLAVKSCDDGSGSTDKKTESLLGTDTEDFEFCLLDTPKEESNIRSRKNEKKHSPSSTVVEFSSDSFLSQRTSLETSFTHEDTFIDSGSVGLDNELEKLENALSRKISTGTFQNRLRMKTLTLTPIQSSQQTMISETGDASAHILQTKSSYVMDIHSIQVSSYDTNILSQYTRPNNVTWGFTHTQIPMQLYTVGYALPEYHSPITLPPARPINHNTICKNLLNEMIEDSLPKEVNNSLLESLSTMEERVHDDYEKNICNENIKDIKNIVKEINVENFESPRMNNELQIDEACFLIKDVESDLSVTIKEPNDTEPEFSYGTDIGYNKIVEKEPMNQSNSLDVLLGLLNEIKNLTECQTQITGGDHYYQKKPSPRASTDHAQSVENIFNNASKFNTLQSMASVPEFETVFSLDISNDLFMRTISLTNKLSVMNINNNASFYIDKNVNKTTDNSGVINILQDHSHDTYNRLSESSINVKPHQKSVKTIDLQHCDTKKVYFKDASTNVELLETNVSVDSEESLNAFHMKKNPIEVTELAEALNTTSLSCVDKINNLSVQEIHKCVVERDLVKPAKRNNNKNRYKRLVGVDELIVRDKPAVTKDVNVVKLKRDILVTVYSILVVTVFAALSLPGLIYRT